MDFVTQFHDTLFDGSDNETKSNRSDNGIYIVKSCPSKWFNEEGDEDDAEKGSKLKFRADRLYSEGKYEEAIDNYVKVIPLLAPTNATIRRDSLEGMIRAAIKLNDINRAEMWIDELMKMAKSSTQLCAVWKLKAKLYFLQQNFKDEIIMWKFVLKYFPQCYEYWLNLGKSLINFYQIYLLLKDNFNIKQLTYNEYNAILLITSCFIRCRTLLETIENNPKHFNYHQKQQIIHKINADINTFSLPKPFLSAAQEHMNGDVRNSEEKLNFEDLLKPKKTNDDLQSIEDDEFDKNWFWWIAQFHKQ